MPPYSVCVYSCPFKNTMNKISFMPKAVRVNYKRIFSQVAKTKRPEKKNKYKRTKESYLLTFSTHRENKPFEDGAEPRRRRAKCKTTSGNKTSLPGAVAVLKTLGAKGPCWMASQSDISSFNWIFPQQRSRCSLPPLLLKWVVLLNHNVLSIASGVSLPSWPLRYNSSTSESVSEREAFGLLPVLEDFRTFCFAFRTSWVPANSME